MKKNLIILMSTVAILATSTAEFAEATPAPTSTPAAEKLNIMPISETTDIEFTAPVSMPSYIANTVTVTEITEESISTTTNKEDSENPENTINYTINDNTIVLGYANGDIKSLKDIKAGDKITVYTNGYSPAPLILPPLYSADVIFVEDNLELDSLRMADVDTYLADGERLVNAANTLALNLDEKTEIVDTKGKKVEAKDLDKKDLAVIYSITTRSIPAQTTPHKVVVLGENEVALAQIEAAKNEAAATPAPEATAAPTDAPENNVDVDVDFTTVKSIVVGDDTITDIYSKDDVLMVPLRKIAETLGFTVDWNGEMRAVLLNSGIYSLKIDENSYIKGKMMPIELGSAPEIKNDLTYVPVEYFLEVIEAEANIELDENGNAEAIDFSISETEAE